jgi:hypothetical protein
VAPAAVVARIMTGLEQDRAEVLHRLKVSRGLVVEPTPTLHPSSVVAVVVVRQDRA